MTPDMRLPAAVRTASWLLVAVAGLSVLNIVNTIAIFHRASAASEVAFADTADGFVNPSTFRFLMDAHIAFDFFAAVIAIVLALVIRRQPLAGRLVTFILASVGLLCFGVAGWENAGHFGFGGVPGDEVTVAAQKSAAAIPGWSETITMGGAIASILLLIAVIVLLSRPAARNIPRVPSGAARG